MMRTNELRHAFGILAMDGFRRVYPLPGAVVGTLMYDGFDSWHRIEAGDHEAALGIELGARARSWMEDIERRYSEIDAFGREATEV